MFDVKFLMLPKLPLTFVEASATLRPVIFAAFFKLAKMFLIFPPEQPAMISFVNNWGIWQHFDSFYKVLIDLAEAFKECEAILLTIQGCNWVGPVASLLCELRITNHS